MSPEITTFLLLVIYITDQELVFAKHDTEPVIDSYL